MGTLQKILDYCTENDCNFIDCVDYILHEKNEWFACLIHNYEIVFAVCTDYYELQECDFYEIA